MKKLAKLSKNDWENLLRFEFHAQIASALQDDLKNKEFGKLGDIPNKTILKNTGASDLQKAYEKAFKFHMEKKKELQSHYNQDVYEDHESEIMNWIWDKKDPNYGGEPTKFLPLPKGI
jgi:hypothetical protein